MPLPVRLSSLICLSLDLGIGDPGARLPPRTLLRPSTPLAGLAGEALDGLDGTTEAVLLSSVDL
jgi:hypothetical protein